MTLQEWSSAYGVQLQRSETGYRMRVFTDDIPQTHPEYGDACWDLFHLSDYAVTANLSGPAYALSERAQPIVTQITDKPRGSA